MTRSSSRSFAPRARSALASLLVAGLAAAVCARQVYQAAFSIEMLLLPAALLTTGLAWTAGLARLLAPRLAPFARDASLLAAIVLGLTLWMLGFSLTYELLGPRIAALATAIFAVGVVPFAMAGAALKGYFVSLFALTAAALLFATAVAACFPSRRAPARRELGEAETAILESVRAAATSRPALGAAPMAMAAAGRFEPQAQQARPRDRDGEHLLEADA
jgi:hypothetical protein